MTRPRTRPLHELAGLHGVQTAYYDIDNRRRSPRAECLLAVLRALGAPVEELSDVPPALRERRLELFRRAVEPVHVAWDGNVPPLPLSLPRDLNGSRISGRLELEGGERRELAWKVNELPELEAREVEGERRSVREIRLGFSLPLGYHRLSLETKGVSAKTLIIAAPRKAFLPRERRRRWGAFVPLYALRTETCWGSGDLGDLASFADWLGELGGTIIGTLPLLASFLDEPFEPSPYSPVSRLFWNELYIDVERVPELADSPRARQLIASPELQAELRALRAERFVDYRRQMALKRKVLEELCRACFAKRGPRLEELRSAAERTPLLEDYARFRAACDRQRSSWQEWPSRAREGVLEPGDFDEDDRRYHLYAQWVVQEQVDDFARRARERDVALYLDLPLGVNGGGFDVWRERDLFSAEASVGAPPDDFFSRGQNWGFPPLHPERLREAGYGYAIRFLRHHLRYARALRVDHVMGLHRLFWVPQGLDALDGTYVRYAVEELYAILTLESRREKCWIIGENLGTVPSYVNSTMARHGLGKMYVLQFQVRPDDPEPVGNVQSNVLASVNTHDAPTFNAFWEGLDVKLRLELELLDEKDAATALEERARLRQALLARLRSEHLLENDDSAAAVHSACLAFLGQSRARLVLASLEDLWLEPEPQNVPGTGQERPNWRRKLDRTFERLRDLPEVVDVLRELDRCRREERKPAARAERG